MDTTFDTLLTRITGGCDGHKLKLVCGIVGLILAAITYLGKKSNKITGSKKQGFYAKPTKYEPPVIDPIDDSFIWDKTPPLKSYPFKDAEYKLTMGIKELDPNDWLLIEPSYLRVLEEKRKLVTNDHPKYPSDFDLEEATVFSTPECEEAIREFYDISLQFMLDRYPKYFKKRGDTVHNSITGDDLPAHSTTSLTGKEHLLLLTKFMEEDVIILLKDPAHQAEEDEYYFKGGVFAFAAGFDPKDKFNTPLTAIHKPIPGYESKMKTSMNRFFNRINPGQFVTRSNFSVQTHDLWFVHDRNKGHNRPEDEVVIPKKVEELDFDNEVHYRSERQVLTRLPKSGAVIFTIRTYLLPLSQIKNDGKEVIDRLSGAVEKFPDDIKTYKNAREWGPAVVEYLRA